MEVTGGRVVLMEAIVAAGEQKGSREIELVGLHSLRSQFKIFIPAVAS